MQGCTVYCTLSPHVVQPCSVHLYTIYDAYRASANRCALFTVLHTTVYCTSHSTALNYTAHYYTLHYTAQHTTAHCTALHTTAHYCTLHCILLCTAHCTEHKTAAHVTIPNVIVRVGFLRITNRRWRSPSKFWRELSISLGGRL